MKQTTLSKIIISAIVIVMMVALSSCNAFLEHLGSPNATTQSEQTTIPSTEETQGTTTPREELTTPSGNEDITTPSGDTQGTTNPGEDITTPSEEITTPSDDPTHVHVIVVDEAVEPTCTKAGLTEGKHCSTCGYVLVEQIEIPALKHNYTSTLVAPTAKENGYTEHVCSRCGYTRKDIIKTVDFVITRENRAMIGYNEEESENLVIPAVFQDGDTWYRVVEISDEAFWGTRKVTRVVLPDSLTSIGEYAFAGCGMTSIIIPDSVTSIGKSAFWRCDFLTNVTIGDSVTSIGDYAFDSCDALTSVTIGDSVISIGSKAFRNCSALTSITIGNSVTSFGKDAFLGCDNITTATMPTSAISAIPKTNLTTLVLTGGTNFETRAFYNCNSLRSVTIGDGLTFISSDAFGSCDNLTSVTIGDNVKSIGAEAFYQCGSLTSVTMGNSVTDIGGGAFEGCVSLTSITIPDSVTSIGYHAFYYCYRLVEVINKSSINITAGSSNHGWVAWYAGEVHNGTTKIINQNDYLFYTYNGVNYLIGYMGTDTELILPESYNGQSYEINRYAFYDCDSLTSVTISSSVTNIGYHAFFYCDSLTSLVVASENPTYYSEGNCIITRNEKALIQGCDNSVIPQGVTSIGDYAFYCGSLTSIVIPDSVKSIGDYAFYWCSSLTSIVIPDSVKSIGDSAFEQCISLESITIGNSVTSIGYRAFFYCISLTSVTMGNSVTSIDAMAFRSCTALTSITIPNSVTSIGYDAFFYCDSLTTIIFVGTVAQWEARDLVSLNWRNAPSYIICTDGTIEM